MSVFEESFGAWTVKNFTVHTVEPVGRTAPKTSKDAVRDRTNTSWSGLGTLLKESGAF